MQDKYEIFADNALLNVFNGALIPLSKQENNPGNHYKVIGYRLESVGVENVRVGCRQPEDVNGAYTAIVYVNGIRRKARNGNATLFPKHWTKDRVINAIFEAYQNRTLRDVSTGRYIGEAADGMHVILWLDENDKVTDAMPFRDELIEFNRNLKRARKGRGICKTCGKPKHLICLEHNSQIQVPALIRIPKRIRYHTRRIYFNLVRKSKRGRAK